MGTRQVDLKALLESRMENIEPAEGSRASIESAEMHIPKNLMYDAESTVFKPEITMQDSFHTKRKCSLLIIMA